MPFKSKTLRNTALFFRILPLKPLFKNPKGLNGSFLGIVLGFIPCGLLYGAFLGFAMYGVYNATNFATYPNKWNIKIATIDTLWGTFVTSITSYFLYKINQ